MQSETARSRYSLAIVTWSA